MARKCKCKLCKNQLTTDVAYKIVNNGKNEYYCDDIEYEAHLKEMTCKQEVLEYINKILGYESVNTIIYKELATIHKTFSYEEILNCFNCQGDKIIELININGIDREFNIIRYMYGVISRSIADDTKEFKANRNKKIVKKISSEEIDIDSNNIKKVNKQKYESKPSTDFSNFF